MSEGIVVKVWNVKANASTRSASAQISDSIEYINNPEKTGVPLNLMDAKTVGNELTYITNEMKTASGLYVGCRHISDITHATEEMMQVKEFFGKLDGRVATHGIISLDESESDPKNAGKLMELLNELMEKVFPNHQVVYAVHTNTENLHIHFIINTVGLNGKKIHMDKTFMRDVMEKRVNELAEKYGFTPNEKWRKEKIKDLLSFPERKMMLRKCIDIAVEQTDSFDAFVAFLRNEGLIVNVAKKMTLQTDEMPFAIRSGQLGDIYSIESIKMRLDEKYDPFKQVVAGDYYSNIMPEEMANITPKKMKAYKDMTMEEKRDAVRLLRLGRNPWTENRQDNWQMQHMADELKNIGYVYKLVNFYSNGSDNAKSAMEEIIDRRKQILEEKKVVRALRKEYKPIFSIYEEMKQYMIRAYLFDQYGYMEYREDFLKYKEAVHRLDVGYGKTVEEVADLAFEINAKLNYLTAQEKELKAEYKAIKTFAENGKMQSICEDYAFFQSIGHSKALFDAKTYGIYASEMKYVIPKDKDIRIRVMMRPAMVDGKPTIATELAVIDSKNQIIRELDSLSMSESEFNKKIYEIQEEFGIKGCSISKNSSENLRRI